MAPTAEQIREVVERHTAELATPDGRTLGFETDWRGVVAELGLAEPADVMAELVASHAPDWAHVAATIADWQEEDR